MAGLFVAREAVAVGGAIGKIVIAELETAIHLFRMIDARVALARDGSENYKKPRSDPELFVCTPPAPGQHHRAGDMIDPLWNLDMTPEGEGRRGFRRWDIRS